MQQIDVVLENIKKAQSGDEEAFNLLKSRYMPLISACSARYVLEGMNSQDVEDLRQEALVHFCRAVCSYDEGVKGVEFGLYAKICIEHGLVSFIRKFKRDSRSVTVSLDEKQAEYADIQSGCDVLQSVIDSEAAAELARTVKMHLSEYENRVWWLYVSGMSVSDIAKKTGASSAKSVSNAIYRIRKKLRAVIGEMR